MKLNPTKIYIAGPMTGIPYFNFPAFFDAQDYLEGYGFKCFSPAEHDIETVGHDFSLEFPTGDVRECAESYGLDHRTCLKADLTWICDEAQAMYMLQGWEKSSGAKTEHALAVAIGIPIYYETTI